MRDVVRRRGTVCGAVMGAVVLAAGSAAAAPGSGARPAESIPSDAPVWVAGDFDGDGSTDVFVHGPGAVPDAVHWGANDGTFLTQDSVVNGQYQPFVGDFDGDGHDDIFWYVAGPGVDSIWYGGASRTFTTVKPANVKGEYQPIVGDFDGDGRDDVFWDAPAPAPDSLWAGTANRGFRTVKPTNVQKAYRTAVADFDGDGRDDVLWHGTYDPSSAWFGSATAGQFTVQKLPARFDPAEVEMMPVAGDFDGDGHVDVLWVEAWHPDFERWATSDDAITWGTGSLAEPSVELIDTAEVRTLGVRPPLVGRFTGEDEIDDVLWLSDAPSESPIWAGAADRSFGP